MAATVLKGDNKPTTMPIQYLDQGEIIINQDKAKQLGITIPEYVLDREENQ